MATDFIITITLSAADATADIIENPLTPNFLHHQEIAITLVLITLLGAVFLRGFREAIGIAVFLVQYGSVKGVWRRGKGEEKTFNPYPLTPSG